jgi:hypothetical protein
MDFFSLTGARGQRSIVALHGSLRSGIGYAETMPGADRAREKKRILSHRPAAANKKAVGQEPSASP